MRIAIIGQQEFGKAALEAFLAHARDGIDPAAALVFFFNDTATTEIYTLSLHDALPIYG